MSRPRTGAAVSLPFFFYGTLRDSDPSHPVARALHRKLHPGVAASVSGRLHALPDPAGWYPALTEGAGDERVIGRLCAARAGFGPADLARIDAYEDCRVDDPAGSTYLRLPMAVRVAGRPDPVTAQVYRFNRPLPPEAVPIPHGDFGAWLVARGGRAYGTAP
ncbi:gamma-glutamylcyclotransferase family protein [Novosphingobium piscinae]|uniref:Gamma-glutamylcyclotransferase n=1 Tax=Novosphingobium piscinae TaxID=1507448 RepID=A0A7X1KRK9_9SPHN|nr:gamma-glutamylcyclotransferase [Novosphingobium piscinae]